MKEENEETVEDKLVPALKTPKPPPLVSVAAVVGGLSAQKQRRILSRGVDVLVATPGRLWDIMQEVCAQLLQVTCMLNINIKTG